MTHDNNDQPRANKTDAGNGSKAICRVSNVLRSPSPDPRRSAKIMEDPEWPLFVFLDDTTLEICQCLEDARRSYEGIDVEAGVYSFFDFAGVPVKPIFIVPNLHSKFLGLIPSCSSGVFEFARGSTSESHVIATALSDTERLTQNQIFATLDDVRRHLERRGCCMEHFYSDRELTQAEQASSGNS